MPFHYVKAPHAQDGTGGWAFSLLQEAMLPSRNVYIAATMSYGSNSSGGGDGSTNVDPDEYGIIHDHDVSRAARVQTLLTLTISQSDTGGCMQLFNADSQRCRSLCCLSAFLSYWGSPPDLNTGSSFPRLPGHVRRRRGGKHRQRRGTRPRCAQ